MGDSRWDRHAGTANSHAAAISVHDGHMAGPQSRPRFLHVPGSERRYQSGRNNRPGLRAFAEDMAGEKAMSFAESERLFAEALKVVAGGTTQAKSPENYIPGAYPIYVAR